MTHPFDIAEGQGLFTVYRGWLAPEDASDLFEQCKRELNWQQPVVKMPWKTYMPHREICEVYASDTSRYRFPGSPEQREEWTPWLQDLRDRLQALSGDAKLNHALLNHYLDGSSYLGYHADSRRDLQPATLIVGLVLGSGRDFLLKSIHGSAGTQKTFMNVGDVFVMDQTLQEHYEHSVPKRARGGERISITYRATKLKKH